MFAWINESKVYSVLHQLNGPPSLVPSLKYWQGVHFDRSGCDYGKNTVTVTLLPSPASFLLLQQRLYADKFREKKPTKQIGNDSYDI